MQFSRLINIGLRGITLASKFLFVFFLAKFLDPHDVGLYGLLTATVGYGIYIVGLEFYTFSSRELIAAAPDERRFILANQLVLYIGWYVLSIPVLFVMSHYRILPSKYVWWTAALLISEHFAQELNRILIALSQQLFASVVLFVRLGLWSLVVIVLQWCVPSTRTIQLVLVAWLIGSICASILGLYRLNKLVPRGPTQMDWRWIARGMRVAVPLLIASVAVRGLATFDRFFVEEVADLDIVAPYVLYLGMATAVISFLDAGVIAFALPKLVNSARTKNIALFQKELSHARNTVWAVGATLIVLSGLAGLVFAKLIGKPVYANSVYLLYWVLAFTAIQVASIVPHLALYALDKDRSIVLSQVCGFCVFLLVFFLLKPAGIVSVMLGLCAAWMVIVVWKTAAYRDAISSFQLNKILI